MGVGSGPSGQLVLRMGEPPPSSCSGGKRMGMLDAEPWQCPHWGELTHARLGQLSPSCQAGSGYLAVSQGIASSLGG